MPGTLTTKQQQAVRARFVASAPLADLLATETETALGPGYRVRVFPEGGQSLVKVLRVTGPGGEDAGTLRVSVKGVRG